MKNIKGMVNKAGREKALPGICKNILPKNLN